MKDLVKFHRHYYQDYCQYKHGLAVSLRNANAGDEPLKGALYTYDSTVIDKKIKQIGGPPCMVLELFPETQPYVRSLHDEKNLLYATIHPVDVDEVLEIAKKSFVLLNTLRINLMRISEYTDETKIEEFAFPCKDGDLCRIMNMGFPRE